MFTSSEEDSDELPSLSSFLPRRPAATREPTPVDGQSETFEDPAEHAIAYRKPRRHCSSSKESSLRRPVSSSTSSSSIAGSSPKQNVSGKHAPKGSVSSASDLSKGLHKASEIQDLTDVGSKEERSTSAGLDMRGLSSGYITSSSESRSSLCNNDDREVLESKSLLAVSQGSTSRESHNVSHVKQRTKVGACDADRSVQMSTLSEKSRGKVPQSSPHEFGGDIDVPLRSCAQEKTDTYKRKSRRITIITISDSEDDDPIVPPKTPGRARAIIESDKEEEDTGVVHELSFADYSDSDVETIETTTKKDLPVQQIIEIDSSDSDNDAARGVISWNPTPRRLKNIVKPSSLLPLSPLPAFTGQPTARPAPLHKPTTPSVAKELDITVTPRVQRKETVPRTVRATPSRKAVRAFAEERDRLAINLLEELNDSVFVGKLPEHLTIVWNGRLNTTAGRANWKKTTNKSTGSTAYQAEIELSVKVIDSADKLKCTLSHELCHIAAWAIDKEMKPSHGPAFKYWGRKIMAARKDIKVTTKHSYEIAYKYQWQCTRQSCGKVYGRHSKSIDPARHACGLCEGRLVRLDKDGNPVKDVVNHPSETPRKESEWTAFSKEAFKRLKAQNPALGMTDINKLVAAEWKLVKSTRLAKDARTATLANQMDRLGL